MKKATEILFNPHLLLDVEKETTPGIPDMIAQSIARCPIDCRKDMWQRIEIVVRLPYSD